MRSVRSGLDAEFSASTWARGVGVCTGIARESGGPRSIFDTIITSPGKVNIMGTTAERFEFQRCMKGSGHPVK